jgi:hypothetical protein
MFAVAQSHGIAESVLRNCFEPAGTETMDYLGSRVVLTDCLR